MRFPFILAVYKDIHTQARLFIYSPGYVGVVLGAGKPGESSMDHREANDLLRAACTRAFGEQVATEAFLRHLHQELVRDGVEDHDIVSVRCGHRGTAYPEDSVILDLRRNKPDTRSAVRITRHGDVLDLYTRPPVLAPVEQGAWA